MAEPSASEQTPLVTRMVTPSPDVSGRRTSLLHKASFEETVLNMMKTAMGTGCLALAYGCQQGGLVLYVLGLAALGVWNVYAVHRLVACLDYIPSTHHLQHQHPAEEDQDAADDLLTAIEEDMDTVMKDDNASSSSSRSSAPTTGSTLGWVAWHALGGDTGLTLVDCMMFLLLLGIIVAYVSAVTTFLAATPVGASPVANAAVAGIVMATVSSLAPHVGFLSKFSALGLAVLFLTFMIIAGYGVFGESSTSTLYVWPASPLLSGISRWFGVTVFGFGTVPLTYVFRSSMQEPRRAVEATAWAIGYVSLLYIVLGVGLYLLFPSLTGDVLSELPQTGWLPATCRLAMVVVILMTAPLLIVPCAELVETKILHVDHHQHERQCWRAVVRSSICAAAVLLAVAMPGFVQVLSFVGCACIGAVSFILPPLLYIRLVREASKRRKRSDSDGPGNYFLFLDVIMLVWGIAATIISTWFTLKE